MDSYLGRIHVELYKEIKKVWHCTNEYMKSIYLSKDHLHFLCTLANLMVRDWSQESFHDNDTMGIIYFLLWWTFLVLSFKNTALNLYFQRYSHIYILHIQCSHQATALRDSRKKKWDGSLKAKKMHPFGRRGKLLVKWTLE